MLAAAAAVGLAAANGGPGTAPLHTLQEAVLSAIPAELHPVLIQHLSQLGQQQIQQPAPPELPSLGPLGQPLQPLFTMPPVQGLHPLQLQVPGAAPYQAQSLYQAQPQVQAQAAPPSQPQVPPMPVASSGICRCSLSLGEGMAASKVDPHGLGYTMLARLGPMRPSCCLPCMVANDNPQHASSLLALLQPLLASHLQVGECVFHWSFGNVCGTFRACLHAFPSNLARLCHATQTPPLMRWKPEPCKNTVGLGWCMPG